MDVLEGVKMVAVICALKRFAARRGTPKLIISNNAKQFHLVEGVLHELWRPFVQDECTSKYFAEKEIEWQFIPEHAPWMGGVYERLIGIVKNALQRSYGERSLSHREFETTIVEIEGITNNRPLTYVDRLSLIHISEPTRPY